MQRCPGDRDEAVACGSWRDGKGREMYSSWVGITVGMASYLEDPVGWWNDEETAGEVEDDGHLAEDLLLLFGDVEVPQDLARGDSLAVKVDKASCPCPCCHHDQVRGQDALVL